MTNGFAFPENCHAGDRVAKVLFSDAGPLTPSDRRIFKKEIEEIVCSYVLDVEKTHLVPFIDDEHDYSCMAVLDVTLRSTGKAERVAELCHRSMPYPLLVILHHPDGRVMFSMAEKRLSRDGKEQTVLEHVVHTAWHTEDSLRDFFTAADYGKFRRNSFLELYRHYVNLLETLEAAEVTGHFSPDAIGPEERRTIMEQIHAIDNELTSLKAQAKQETELPKQVQLNIKARHLMKHREELVGKLVNG
jgi:hypothetical protein